MKMSRPDGKREGNEAQRNGDSQVAHAATLNPKPDNATKGHAMALWNALPLFCEPTSTI